MQGIAAYPRIWSRFEAAFEWTIDLVFPPICSGCGRPDKRYCAHCLRDLQAVPLQVTARPIRNLDRVFATGAHDGVLKSAVHALKYSGAEELADPLAERLILVLARVHLHVDAILPVPLHSRRQAERGYNQAEILCRVVAAKLDLPSETDLLKRVRNTKQQAQLSPAERERNVNGAFEADGNVGGKTFLLVDDVTTTGATLSDCARALRDQGAAAVFGIVISEPRRSDEPARR